MTRREVTQSTPGIISDSTSTPPPGYPCAMSPRQFGHAEVIGILRENAA